jgi:hypothetical protein
MTQLPKDRKRYCIIPYSPGYCSGHGWKRKAAPSMCFVEKVDNDLLGMINDQWMDVDDV